MGLEIMNQYKKIEINEVEVKFGELIKYLFRNIIGIVGFALLMMVVIPALILLLNKNSIDDDIAIQNEGKYNSQRLQMYKEQLSAYSKRYESLLNKQKESILMKLDPNDLYVLSIQFIVDTTDENEMDVMTAYSNYCLNGNLATDMFGMNNSIEEKYLNEIIKATCSDYSAYEISAVLDVKVYGYSEEFCISYANIVKESFALFSDKLTEHGKENRVEVISEKIFNGSDAGIKKIQDEINTSISTLELDIAKIKSNISSLENNGVEIDDEWDDYSNSEHNILYVIIGFFGGLIIALIVVAIKYIFSNNIKYAEEISEYTGIVFLGKLKCSKNTIGTKIIEVLFRNSKYSNEIQEKIILSRLKVLYSVDGKNEIDVIGRCNEEVIKNIKFDKFSFNNIGDIIENPDSIERFDNASENVLLVISSSNTNYIYVNEILEFCNIRKTNIIGYIYVE